MTEDSLRTHYEHVECPEDCLDATLFIGSKLEIQCMHKCLHMTSLFASQVYLVWVFNFLLKMTTMSHF